MASDIISATSSSSSSTSSSSQSSLGGLANDFDTFLTLLTTQLANQDPLDPLDTNEFTNQLVMFADVEQQVKQSSQLDDLITLNQSNENIGAVSYIGHDIEAEGTSFNLFADQDANVGYTLPETAANAAIQIFDNGGNLVRIENVPKTAGVHSFAWDGKNDSGQELDPGVYSFLVGAVNANDQPIQPTHTVTGRVTGVQTDANGTILLMNDIGVPANKVVTVKEAAST